MWLSNYELDTRGGEVRVLNSRGRVVAQVGKRMNTGGVDIDEKTLRKNKLMGERELHKLSERCPGHYSLVLGD